MTDNADVPQVLIVDDRVVVCGSSNLNDRVSVLVTVDTIVR